ncbi:hypothetical protein ACFLXQ_01970 [Chloroflexota bacterium]
MPKIWLGLVVATVLGILWLSMPYLSSAYYLDRGNQHLAQENSQAAIAGLVTGERCDLRQPDSPRCCVRLIQPDQPGTPRSRE